MWIEEILYRYPADKAGLNVAKLTMQAFRQNILDESAISDGVWVQNSVTSDPTACKAIRIITNMSEADARNRILQLKVDLIENALSALSEKQFSIIQSIYFNRLSYAAIDLRVGVSKRTCQRIKKEALQKLEPLLEVILMLTIS